MDNKPSKRFSLRERKRSFKYAFNGLKILFREEHNARIHLLIALIVIACGFIFNITLTEWAIVCFAIGLVIAIEIINSSIESLADFISPEYHNLIKKVKDLSAAAVLVSAISSIIVGLLIFIPKIIYLVNR